MSAIQEFHGRDSADLWNALANATTLVSTWRRRCDYSSKDIDARTRAIYLSCAAELEAATAVGAKLLALPKP